MEAVEPFLGLIDPFKRIYDYLKAVQETREVRTQLRNLLRSLDSYAKSAKASRDSGNAMYDVFVALTVPISLKEGEDLIRHVIRFCDDFAGIISSVIMFGRECNYLNSGEVEGFMQNLKSKEPQVHDFLTSFGRYYKSKTDSLDLTNLPMLFRLYAPKVKRKHNDELSKTVARGRDQVGKAMQKGADVMMHGFPRIRDRRLLSQYVRSVNHLGKTMRRVKSSKSVGKELGRNAPPWLTDLVEIVEEVQKSLPRSSRPSIS